MSCSGRSSKGDDTIAFKDITKVLYDGRVKLDYKDKTHRYYVRTRVDFDLPEDDPKAWSKIIYPKGTTTLLGDTLEKKGLMTWPLGLALRELFGFYDFTNDNGEKMTGFSKGVGTLWEDGHTLALDKDTLLPLVKSANEAWTRKQKKGADIGSVVHDAIEHYVLAHTNNPEKKDVESIFDIKEQYLWNIKEANPDPTSPEFEKAMEEFEHDVECAEKAFHQFRFWWDTTSPTLYGAEDLLYSEVHNVCGTYDGDLGINREHHPVFKDQPIYRKVGELGETIESDTKIVRVTADWKTSNASKSKDAAAPEGVYYSYFIQLAIYELMRREMGFPPADDLLTVSARKDGGFTLIYASELGLTVQDCIDWAVAVILCYKLADKTKKGLLAHPPEEVK